MLAFGCMFHIGILNASIMVLSYSLRSHCVRSDGVILINVHPVSA